MATVELERLIEDCISKHDVHLIDLVIKGEGNGKSVELFIDAETGVTTGMCSDVSKEVDGMIEASGVVKGSYRLTVSSPGLTRPLRFGWQYRKHIGRRLALKVRAPEDDERNVVGKLESMDETTIVLMPDKHTSTESIRIEEIVEARVMAPW